MSEINPRFGVWSPVSGGFGPLQHPEERPDASWEHNKRVILLAEELGFDSTLVAQHTISTRGPGHEQLEAWTASAALAALTQRIEVITAIKPYLYHPVVLAKMALQIEEVSRGRFGINLVNAWYKPELDRAGIGFNDHDERYAYGTEWLTIFRELVAGREVSFQGRYFKIDQYELWPKDKFRTRPFIYAGGESGPARTMVSELADVWFINGQPIGDVRKLIGDLPASPRRRQPLRYGLAAFVIARETDAEAEQALAYSFELAGKDSALHAQRAANTDPKAVMFQTFAKLPHIGTNGGTAAGLVGSYDKVAARIREFNAAGIELFMLQFQPMEAEMKRFAAEIMPRVRRLKAVA
jgi:alkanesulfonate monooxygenase